MYSAQVRGDVPSGWMHRTSPRSTTLSSVPQFVFLHETQTAARRVNTVFLSHFYIKTNSFTKTGSGQTYRENSNKDRFLAVSIMRRRVSAMCCSSSKRL
jgi:hypothetical protein